MPSERLTLTVTQLNEYVKGLIDKNEILSNVYIKGEISNFTHHRTGHLYFTLKDEGSKLSAVMFASAAGKLAFAPENGMKVIAHGRISAFVRDGNYQIYVSSMEPDGIGALALAFDQLKKKLAAEGLFDPAKKKPLPKIPTRVGIITSPTGAAVRDIINITSRRFPYARLYLYPAQVQGDEAAPQLIEGVRYFNQTMSVDVIIIGRGGGSIEDLWAFNNEELARTVAASKIPTISAVGHEIDFTICDFVADMRAPTPSAAAELAVPDTADLMRKVNNITTHMQLLLSKRLSVYKESVKRCENARVLQNPQVLLDDRRMLLLADTTSLVKVMKLTLSEKRQQFTERAAKMEALNPMSVLLRGYSAVFDDSGELIKSVSDVEIGDRFTLRMSDGTIIGKVMEKEKMNYGKQSE